MTSPASARSGLDPSLASLTGSAALPGAVRTQVPDKRLRVPSHRDRTLLALLLGGTAILYLWGLDQSGWANQFYAAAGQAGSQSWKAFLFGSLDASNFITVDKSPASLWVIDLSMRLFGVNSWSLLIPQALEGVAAVGLVYAAVKRVAGPNAGLLAGAALATTPVATLMFRYDNPDALLVLLLTASAYATVRALEFGRLRWLVLAGTVLGFAFLTKMLQAVLVVPGVAVAYGVAAPISPSRRLAHLLATLGVFLVSAGWWVALVELWPARSRPYIGGTNRDSILELIFGYNGIGRLDGTSNNGNPGGGTGGFSSGQTGLARLFGTEMGSQISWLLPAALVALAGVLWLTRAAPRTDRLRASTLLWGGWLIVTAAVFSFASGIIHPYYTVALAPAIAALVAIGVVSLWPSPGWISAILVAGAVWTFELLGRGTWQPWLAWVVLFAGIVAAGGVLARRWTRLTAVTVGFTLLAAPTAYAVQTASTAHTGAIPSAGPDSSFTGPGGNARFGGATGAGFGRTFGRLGPGGVRGFGATGGGPGGIGLGGATTVSSDLTAALRANSADYRWVAATTGDNEAATLQLASGRPVMALGGYNGTDPAISLAAFQQLVARGEIHYYVLDQGGFIGSTSAQSSTAYAIQQWVTSTFGPTTIGNSTAYDLTSSTSG
jgi:4-amino-4-deoxy-L-arabinose transferase-like glycosyltransferase